MLIVNKFNQRLIDRKNVFFVLRAVRQQINSTQRWEETCLVEGKIYDLC